MTLKLKLAQEKIIQAVKLMTKERVSLEDSWLRVLAESLIAVGDFPAFDRSPLDGYALIAAEIMQASQSNPVHLQVIDNIPAGTMPRATIVPGTCARIMTGAPLPQGATGVVRLEDTEEKAGAVAIFAGCNPAKNICHRGEEIAAGELLLSPGAIINAGTQGMLAINGIANPCVYKVPKVSIIATGSEIISIDEPLTPGTIRNSNSYMIAGQVKEAGGSPRILGIAKDDVKEIADLLEMDAESDLIITTGGVSAGDYDMLPQVYKELGINIMFDRVGIKPGMPVLAGTKGDKLYLGLSGNPSAASVAFELLGRPAVLKMSGRTNLFRPTVEATLEQPFNKSGGAPRFVWAKCRCNDGEFYAEPLRHQGNGMLKSAVSANSLIMIPENSPPLGIGSKVQIMVFTIDVFEQ